MSKEPDLKLVDLPIEVFSNWLTEPRYEEAVLHSGRDNGAYSLYIRDTDGTMVRIKRILAELEPFSAEEMDEKSPTRTQGSL